MTESRKRQTSSLLALRDGELFDAAAAEATRKALVEDADLRATQDKLVQIKLELNSLPELAPDESVWQAIQARAQGSDMATGTPTASGAWKRVAVILPLAAGLVLAISLGTNLLETSPDVMPGGVVAAPGADLAELYERSRRLEPYAQRARAMPMDPTQEAMIYRIADVDAQLAEFSETDQINQREIQELWGQRVALLESLTEIRRARVVVRHTVY